ncbi:MAG: sulfurtransferase TusA family protein [Ferrimonas sp.]
MKPLGLPLATIADPVTVVDLRHLRCPMAFVQAKLAVVERHRQRPLQLLLSDHGTRLDVPQWLNKNKITFTVLVDDSSGMLLHIHADIEEEPSFIC